MTELFIAANVLMLICLAASFTGKRFLLRTICGGLTSLFSGVSAGLLVYMYRISGGHDADMKLLQFYLPVIGYALIFLFGALQLLKNDGIRETQR